MATGHVRDGCIFPVGFIVHLTVDTDPAEFFGGKWQRIKGRFLLAADDTYPAGSTGGEAEHTLTVDELPDVPVVAPTGTRTGHGTIGGSNMYTWTNDWTHYWKGQPHNNMPPYRSVYIWERIG